MRPRVLRGPQDTANTGIDDGGIIKKFQSNLCYCFLLNEHSDISIHWGSFRSLVTRFIHDDVENRMVQLVGNHESAIFSVEPVFLCICIARVSISFIPTSQIAAQARSRSLPRAPWTCSPSHLSSWRVPSHERRLGRWALSIVRQLLSEISEALP